MGRRTPSGSRARRAIDMGKSYDRSTAAPCVKDWYKAQSILKHPFGGTPRDVIKSVTRVGSNPSNPPKKRSGFKRQRAI
jgi:hypothetical protein